MSVASKSMWTSASRALRGSVFAASAALLAPCALACELRIESVSGGQLAYDPFGFNTPAKITASVVLLDGEPCSADVRLARPDGGQLDSFGFGEGAIMLGARALAGVGVQPGMPASAAKISLSPDRPRAEIAWEIPVLKDAVMRPGEHSAEYAVAVRAEGGTADILQHGMLLLRVLSRAQVNVAGATSAFGSSTVSAIDFGELETGESRRAYVQMRANTGVTLSIASRNGGVLKLDGVPGAPGIDYDVFLDGRLLDLAGPTETAFAPPRTMDGLSAPLDIVIGKVEGALAGVYQDYLSIDISPR